jgi:hypothetical protein
MSELSILYIGSLAPWCNSLRRFKAIKEIVSDTDAINTDPYILVKYISAFQHHLNFGPGVYLLNKKVKAAINKKRYDIILVDNKPYLSANTLRFIKKKQPDSRIANLLTDDPFGKFSRSWPRLKNTISLYDIFFVQRQVNVEELKSRGAKEVEICYRSFDPAFDRPGELTEEDKIKYNAPIGFVGTYENVRASYIAYLIRNDIPVSVRGNDWPGGEYWEVIKPFYKGPSVYEQEYDKALNGLQIALHFLRHGNRDEQDSRTFELTARKIFMIAERSSIHEQLFKKDKEAVFFSSKEELLEKVKYYLGAPEERKKIAGNGHRRCLESKHDHRSRMEAVINSIMAIKMDDQSAVKSFRK